jgi:hypothetical protein
LSSGRDPSKFIIVNNVHADHLQQSGSSASDLHRKVAPLYPIYDNKTVSAVPIAVVTRVDSLAAASQGKKKRNHEVKLQRKGKRARVQTSTRIGLGKSRQA